MRSHLDTRVIIEINADFAEVDFTEVCLEQEVFSLQELIVFYLRVVKKRAEWLQSDANPSVSSHQLLQVL